MQRHGHSGRTAMLEFLHHYVGCLCDVLRGTRCVSVSGKTSLPDSTRSLANRYIYLRHVDFGVEAALDFLFRGGLVEQFYRFLEVLVGFGDTRSLAGDVELGAKRNVTIPLTLNDRRQSLVHPTSPLTCN